jgi:hypothetical protein
MGGEAYGKTDGGSELANELRRFRADLIGWHAGLRRLPVVRATGLPDDHPGWNRFLLGPAGERRYAGAVLVWDNRESEMANLPEIEPLLFVLKSGSCGAEVVLLN